MTTAVQLGQNFLINTNVAEKIVRHFLPTTGPIVEVGPGKGILTDLVVKYAEGNKIKVVELDMAMFYKIRDQYAALDHFEAVNRNILKVEPDTLFAEGHPFNLISNVPYYISHEFIDWVIGGWDTIQKGVLMMQKEFVDKLRARPGVKEYNAQGIVLNFLFRVEKLFDVSPGSFSPQPKVKSTVFSITQDADPAVKGLDMKDFYLYLRNCFKNRRKTFINNLDRCYHPETLWAIIEDLGINARIRSEQLTADELLAVYNRLQ